jgi:hypothetical protein
MAKQSCFDLSAFCRVGSSGEPAAISRLSRRVRKPSIARSRSTPNPALDALELFSNPRSLRSSTSQRRRNSRLMTEADGTPTIPQKAAPRIGLMPRPVLVCARSTQQNCLHSQRGTNDWSGPRLHSTFPFRFRKCGEHGRRNAPVTVPVETVRNQQMRISTRSQRQSLLAT